MTKNTPFLGITVLGDFILSEGVDAVLDNVARAGATAVACNPTVTAAAPEGTGNFQPPDDAGTSPRLFDRPLFGKRSLWVHSGPSYRPNPKFYEKSSYGPRTPNALTDEHGHVIGEFIEAALNRDMKVYFQVGAAQPSGLRDEDRPRMPNGEIPPNRMADTASLASPAVRAYNRAYVHDLLAAYPDVTGFRIDWPEYPCYTFGEVFQGFASHVAAWSAERGFDFAEIRQNIAAVIDSLQGQLTTEALRDAADSDGDGVLLSTVLASQPQVREWLRFKAALSTDLIQDWRDIVDDASQGNKELSANAFMPPYSTITGLDFPAAAEHCHAISPKLYTMHWALMVNFWGRRLLETNPGLEETTLVRALVNLLDLAAPEPAGETLADYAYPQPDEPHPIPDAPQRRKIQQVKQAVGGRAQVTPLVHGYGPADDFARRFRLVAESNVDGVWINRYGYLSDAKLKAVGEIWRGRG